jgi:hypothetical protein
MALPVRAPIKTNYGNIFVITFQGYCYDHLTRYSDSQLISHILSRKCEMCFLVLLLLPPHSKDKRMYLLPYPITCRAHSLSCLCLFLCTIHPSSLSFHIKFPPLHITIDHISTLSPYSHFLHTFCCPILTPLKFLSFAHGIFTLFESLRNVSRFLLH